MIFKFPPLQTTPIMFSLLPSSTFPAGHSKSLFRHNAATYQNHCNHDFEMVPSALLVAAVIASSVEQNKACTYIVGPADTTGTILDSVSVAIGILALLVAILQLQEHRRLHPHRQARQAGIFELELLL